MHEEYGADVAVQVVILGSSSNPLSDELFSTPFPSNWTLHWFLYSQNKFSRELNSYHRIASRNGQRLDFFGFGTDPHSLLPLQLESFVKETFRPHHTIVAIGHIQLEGDIWPSPHISGWGRIAQRHGFPFLFPSILSVSGFLPDVAVVAPPSLARYLIIPRKGSSITDSESSTSSHSQAPHSSSASSSSTTAPSTSNGTSSSLYILERTLRETKRAAIVQLGTDWHGIVLSQASRTFLPRERISTDVLSMNLDGTAYPDPSQRVLVLLVLPKHSVLPFIGPLSSLVIEGNYEPGILCIDKAELPPPREAAMEVDGHSSLSAAATLRVHPIPTYLQSPEESFPSYYPKPAGDEILPLYGDAGSILLEMSRLNSYLQDLPSQRRNLFKQADRLRQISVLFCIPDLMTSISRELRGELNRLRGPTLTAVVISKLIEDLSHDVSPLEWDDVGEAEIERVRMKKKSAKSKKSSDQGYES